MSSDRLDTVNSRLGRLQPYPFDKLRTLFAGITPPAMTPVRLSIGEPQHATPQVIKDALTSRLDGLSSYPLTIGIEELRESIAAWAMRRYGLPRVDAATQVLPVNGTREALFAFAQAVIDPEGPAKAGHYVRPVVVSPNPFYQIYEGAALLAGAEPVFLNQIAVNDFDLDLDSITDKDWRRTQLMYVCSPGNPTGRVLTLDAWRAIFACADKYGFVVASDECYSEIYPDEATPPLGALEAASKLGRETFKNLVVFTSLSKRSNAPGLRSGAVIGDAAILKSFLLYRTYHGSAMSLVTQHASIAAWNDETHVRENREKYRAKFHAVVPMLKPVMHGLGEPDASFYLWARVPGGDDETFAKELFADKHVTVLPGTYLARDAHGMNPGRGYARMALVAELDECIDGAKRIVEFLKR